MAKDELGVQRLPLPKSCMCCGSDGALNIVGRCHPRSGTKAVLTGNILTLKCVECDGLITRFEVTCRIKMG